MSKVPDTLVFKIIEKDCDTNVADTILYIIYDTNTRKYVIRGKRQVTKKLNSCTYSFECKRASDLCDFVKFLIDQSNTLSYILYNYDNLPATSNEITYEFLEEYDERMYEISGYDDLKFDEDYLHDNLRILRKVKNVY